MQLSLGVSLAALLCVAPAAFAQTRAAVEFEHAGNDIVGQRIAYAIREGIRSSRGMELVADFKIPRIRLVLVSVAASSANSANASALSITYAYDSLDMPLQGAYLTSEVLFCGSDRVSQCADGIVASTDAAIERLRKSSDNLWRTLLSNKPR